MTRHPRAGPYGAPARTSKWDLYYIDPLRRTNYKRRSTVLMVVRGATGLKLLPQPISNTASQDYNDTIRAIPNAYAVWRVARSCDQLLTSAGSRPGMAPIACFLRPRPMSGVPLSSCFACEMHRLREHMHETSGNAKDGDRRERRGGSQHVNIVPCFIEWLDHPCACVM